MIITIICRFPLTPSAPNREPSSDRYTVLMLHTLPFLFRTASRRKWGGSIVPPPRPPAGSLPSLWASPGAKEKIKTNRTLISGPRFSLVSCRQKEPSPGRLPQIKASCSPLAASPIRITTTKPAETIIYSF